MVFISLGRHCSVAYNIKKFINNDRPTHFFDWSRTDFKCVLSILQLSDLNEIFNVENIKIDKELYKKDCEFTMTLKKFNKDNLCLMYHHDIKYSDYNDLEFNEQLTNFIDKYKRRYNRLIKLIKTDTKIYFIYNITNMFDYNDCDLFNKILTNINKNINYSLILLIEEGDDTSTYTKGDNYFKINLTHFIDTDITPNWMQEQYDWKNIFRLIHQNILKI